MLPDFTRLMFFLMATLMLNLTPGSDVIYIASQSLQSHRHGLLAALGISIGATFYVIMTAFGMTEVLRQSPILFQCIKVAGAMYLIYLACKIFRSSFGEMNTINETSHYFKTFYRGIANTILNPKVGIFFITFLPQFVDQSRGKIWMQLLSLGGCFIISGTIVNVIYALMFAQLKQYVFSHSFMQKWMNKITALIFGSIALKVLLT